MYFIEMYIFHRNVFYHTQSNFFIINKHRRKRKYNNIALQYFDIFLSKYLIKSEYSIDSYIKNRLTNEIRQLKNSENSETLYASKIVIRNNELFCSCHITV